MSVESGDGGIFLVELGTALERGGFFHLRFLEMVNRALAILALWKHPG